MHELAAGQKKLDSIEKKICFACTQVAICRTSASRLDFSVWGILKSKVGAKKYQSFDHSKQALSKTFQWNYLIRFWKFAGKVLTFTNRESQDKFKKKQWKYLKFAIFLKK